MPAKLESETEQAFFSVPRANLEAVRDTFTAGHGRERERERDRDMARLPFPPTRI